MNATAPISVPLIRGPRKRDQSFIASTWLKQLADVDRDYARGERWGQAGKHVDGVLDRDDTRALIRYAPGDPDAILAWIVFAEGPGVPLMHFVYTRREHRRKRLASDLLMAIGIQRGTSFVFTTRGPMTRLMLGVYPHAAHLPLGDFLK